MFLEERGRGPSIDSNSPTPKLVICTIDYFLLSTNQLLVEWNYRLIIRLILVETILKRIISLLYGALSSLYSSFCLNSRLIYDEIILMAQYINLAH